MVQLAPIPRLVMPSFMTDTERKERDTEFSVFSLHPCLVFSVDDGSIFWLLRSFNRARLDTGFHLSSSITAQICQNCSCRTPLQYDLEKNQTGNGSVQTRELQTLWALIWPPRTDDTNCWCNQRSCTLEPCISTWPGKYLQWAYQISIRKIAANIGN